MNTGARLADNRNQFPVVYRDLRRALVQRFPYVMLFRVDPDAVVVVARVVVVVLAPVVLVEPPGPPPPPSASGGRGCSLPPPAGKRAGGLRWTEPSGSLLMNTLASSGVLKLMVCGPRIVQFTEPFTGMDASCGPNTLPNAAWTFRPLQGVKSRAGVVGGTVNTWSNRSSTAA